ncbi:hypothetical protein BN8_00615 [Fibrisoma limi BUZ 3]|uniref:Uncharacterized protein n=1 Tax=Fibrisoma limi BUZ 3 TaxID=1185876 RepID=I2GCP9_9BACT|nr:hypothetical protein [Fibrisoma limi]CCH51673.1 hypothetical protein BN8_00615 [Fibrisoma limi BUZ 3]
MRNSAAYLLLALSLFSTSCHRPYAYFQPSQREHFTSARPVAPTSSQAQPEADSAVVALPDSLPIVLSGPALASLPTPTNRSEPTTTRVQRHMHRAQSMLATPSTLDKQPRPKPKPKMRLGNRIREKLGMPLRKELNWWQRISWKLKASVIVILIAVIFALTKVTLLAVIFGLLGAFLLISGLRRSFKTRRPWF